MALVEEPSPATSNRRPNIRRRGAISSEPTFTVNQTATPITPSVKTNEEKSVLEDALRQNLLFSHLEEEERQELLEVMFEVSYGSNEIIIKQGDEGVNFYVLKQGKCEIFVTDASGNETLVSTVVPPGTFGELALMYNCPRAATVKTVEPSILWAIDRITYRKVLMDSTMKKRKAYESFLEKVPMLEACTRWERLAIADALEPVSFPPNTVIVRQGEEGNIFYIILDGEVKVTQVRDGVEKVLCELHNSDYFGELALLLNCPRAATVTSIGHVKCVKLDRERFNRVLGPCEDILRRNIENYNLVMAASSCKFS